MRSIIDEIAAAEEEAEKIRQEALMQAREQTANARGQAEQALLDLAAAEHAITERDLEAARIRGEKAAQVTLGEMEREAEKCCALAAARMDRAVAYLVEKAGQTA